MGRFEAIAAQGLRCLVRRWNHRSFRNNTRSAIVMHDDQSKVAAFRKMQDEHAVLSREQRALLECAEVGLREQADFLQSVLVAATELSDRQCIAGAIAELHRQAGVLGGMLLGSGRTEMLVGEDNAGHAALVKRLVDGTASNGETRKAGFMLLAFLPPGVSTYFHGSQESAKAAESPRSPEATIAVVAPAVHVTATPGASTSSSQ